MAPSTIQTTSSASGRGDKSEAPDPVPRLTLSAARRYVRLGLQEGFNGAFTNGGWKTIRNCSRVSRIRLKCRRVSWSIGDSAYRGWVTIWYAPETDGSTSWNYAYRLVRTDTYCRFRKAKRDPGLRRQELQEDLSRAVGGCAFEPWGSLGFCGGICCSIGPAERPLRTGHRVEARQ